MDVTQLQNLTTAVGNLISVGYSVMKGNLLSLFGLAGIISAVKGVDFAAVKTEVAALDPAALASLEATFKTAVSGISDPLVVATITTGADILNQAYTVVEDVLKVVNEGTAVINRVKTLLGV